MSDYPNGALQQANEDRIFVERSRLILALQQVFLLILSFSTLKFFNLSSIQNNQKI